VRSGEESEKLMKTKRGEHVGITSHNQFWFEFVISSFESLPPLHFHLSLPSWGHGSGKVSY